MPKSTNLQHLTGNQFLALVGDDVQLSKPIRGKAGAGPEYYGPAPDGSKTRDGFRVWPEHPSGKPHWWCRNTDRRGDDIDYLVEFHHMAPADARARVLQLTGAASGPGKNGKSRHSTPGRVVATFDYPDEVKTILYRTERIEPGKDGRSKDFRCAVPDERGGWTSKPGCMDGVRRILYRLPDVLRNEPGDVVIIAEGEAKADALAAMGFVGTAIAGGASGPLPPDMVDILAGHDVVILPDNDQPGRKFADKLAGLLAGSAASVKVVELPGLPVKGDVIDWRKAGGTAGELNKLIAAAPTVDSSSTPARHGRRVEYTAAELLAAEFASPSWAVPGILPEGLTFLAGRPKVGKSWLALQIAIAVSTGGMALGQRVEPGKVLYIALEDNARRFKERMHKQMMPASEALVVRFELEHLNKGGGEWLRARLENDGYRLVIIDTLSRCAGRVDQQDVGEMTTMLGDLQRLALELHTAILVIDHHRKSAGMVEDVIDDVLGSTAKSAVSDAVMGLFRQRGKKGATLRATGRDLEERDLALEWDGLTCIWQVLGDATEIETTDREREIIDALVDLGSATNQDVANAIGQDKGNTYKRLQELVRTGKVIKTTVDRAIRYKVSDTNTTTTTDTTITTPYNTTTSDRLL